MIYYSDIPAPERFGDWQQYLPYLSGQRIRQIECLRREIDRRASVCTFLLLRQALFMETGMTDMPVFSFSENGKPALTNGSVFFNLSHSDTAVACAVAGGNVGVDIQPVAPVKAGVARRVLSETELVYVLQSDNSDRTFTSLWTMKESFGKYTGEGIGYEMRNTSFPFPVPGQMPYKNGMFSLAEEENYSVCAYAKSALTFRRIELDIDRHICYDLEKRKEERI